MKKPVTYVDQDKLLALARELGLGITEQKGFIKVSGPLAGRCYVARTKSVGRIDISGFEVSDLEGVRHLGEGERFGAVHQQVDFARTEDEILATFRAVLEAMVRLPAPAPKAAPVAKTAKAESAPEPKMTKAQRAAAIKDRAQAGQQAATADKA